MLEKVLQTYILQFKIDFTLKKVVNRINENNISPVFYTFRWDFQLLLSKLKALNVKLNKSVSSMQSYLFKNGFCLRIKIL